MRIAFLLLATLALAPSPARARYLFELDDGEHRLELRTAFKSSWLLSFPLTEGETSGAGLNRLRFDLTGNFTEHFTAQVAYEHRLRLASTQTTGAGLLPPTTGAPFRVEQLDWAVIDDGAFAHRHEIDRALIALHLPFADLTVGRQAIGLGRGMMFSAIDVFAPFSPTEVDREWRRGIDAVRLELRIPDFTAISASFIAAFGPRLEDDWAMIGRLRAVVGEVDGELIIGRRATDNIVGGALSATVGDAEVHGELAFFGTDGRGIDGGLAGTDAVVMKAVVGGSYMIDVGTGLRIAAEYHYSGFGVENLSRDPRILFDPDFQLRLARGDTQTLGRHTFALTASYSLSDEVAVALAWINSRTDGSGLINVALTWVQSDSVTLLASAFVPWGAGPSGGVPGSELGGSPFTLFVQARIYD